jgi:hypothetical protein
MATRRRSFETLASVLAANPADVRVLRLARYRDGSTMSPGHLYGSVRWRREASRFLRSVLTA